MSKPITIYLDMDGVLADFHKEYAEYRKTEANDHAKFFSAIHDHKIFEKLDLFPGAMELLNHVALIQYEDPTLNIEILTSKGTHDPFRGAESKEQKLNWLKKHNIKYKANFVCCKEEKAEYATPNSILIDDSIGCIKPFEAEGGKGILYKNYEQGSTELDFYLSQMRALNAERVA